MAPAPMPDELSPRHIGRRLLQFATVAVVVALAVVFGPGLGTLRTQLSRASPGWIVAGVAFEILSALSYVVIFRAVFCPAMSWRISYQIGMSEQAANSVLSVSGAGGLALGAWALHRGGMSTEHIARRSVAFFFLTSMANVAGVIVFAALYAVGILGHDPNPTLTYGFGVAALLATAVVLAIPALLAPKSPDAGSRTPPGSPAAAAPSGTGRVARALHFARTSLAQGVRDGLALLRHHPTGVVIGSVGTMAFDLAVLGVAFVALGAGPPFGVLVLGYLIGQLGGNIPVPGGIGGLDAGLVGAFVLYHVPVAAATAAVLIYHAISLWVPALLGSVAFVQLRSTLRTADRPAAICAPLAEPVEAVSLPSAAR